MVIRNEPCLATAHLRELIRKLPPNVYVQRITIEACRIYKNDGRRPETQLIEAKQCYPNIYVSSQSLIFRTPLMINAVRFDKSDDWEHFCAELDQLDSLCGKFDFREEKELRDIPISDRLYIKDVLLLELPKDDPNYREPPYNCADPEDKFYGGMRCSYVTFTGAYQLLGSPVEEIRDGMLPGMTRKPMDIECIEIVRTKHARKLLGTKFVKCFHHGKEDIYKESLDDLVNHPERVKAWLPTLSSAGLIIWRKVEGDWKESMKLQVKSISLSTMLEEGEI
jgi:hypothetical protein